MGRQDDLVRAWELFQCGGLEEAENIASAGTDPAGLHILLWIALRRGDQEAKLRYATELSRVGDPRLSAVGRAHQNVALVALGREPERWIDSKSRWARSEIAYARALIAFTRSEPSDVRRELQQALPQTTEQRVRYAQLRAWTSALQEDYVSQASRLVRALSMAIMARVDRPLIARVAAALAPLVQEVELHALSSTAEQLLNSISWPVDASRHQFFAVRAVGWRNALRGDWINALRHLDSALASAPNSMLRGVIFADRARINSAIGETVTAASARESSFASFLEVDWKRLNRDEAMMIFAAIDVLSEDRQRGNHLFSLANQIRSSPLIGASFGTRLSAFRDLAQSYLLEGDACLNQASTAYHAFKQIGYVHRASVCALRAFEISRSARWKNRAEKLLEPYPRSLASCQFRKLTSPATRLSGRLREVADLLVTTGLTAREIGTKLGIAEGTVRVHIKRINKLLNTSSRSELVRYFRDNGSAA